MLAFVGLLLLSVGCGGDVVLGGNRLDGEAHRLSETGKVRGGVALPAHEQLEHRPGEARPAGDLRPGDADVLDKGDECAQLGVGGRCRLPSAV
jgi:hypothetical protein